MLGDEGTLLGIAAIIAALLAGLPGVIAALYGKKIHKEVRTPNGDPRTTGQVITDTAKQVGVPEPEHQDTPPPPKE